MHAGPLLFIAVAAVIGLAGFFISRRFRRSVDRGLPGADESGTGLFWYSRRPPDGDG